MRPMCPSVAVVGAYLHEPASLGVVPVAPVGPAAAAHPSLFGCAALLSASAPAASRPSAAACVEAFAACGVAFAVCGLGFAGDLTDLLPCEVVFAVNEDYVAVVVVTFAVAFAAAVVVVQVVVAHIFVVVAQAAVAVVFVAAEHGALASHVVAFHVLQSPQS